MRTFLFAVKKLSGDFMSAELKKHISAKGLLALGVAGIIGTSWTYMNTVFYMEYGSGGTILGFGIGVLMATLIALSYAELGAAIKREGGEIAFAYPVFGLKGSFVVSWMLFLGYITGALSFYVVSLGYLLSYLFPVLNVVPLYTIAGFTIYLPTLIIGISGALAFFFINYRGVKVAMNFQTLMFIMLLGLGALAVMVALVHGSFDNMQPLFPPETNPLEISFGFTLVTIGYLTGFSMLTMVGEESAVKSKTFGVIIVLSVVLAGLFYIIEMFAGAYMLPTSEMHLTRGLIEEMSIISPPLGYAMWIAAFIGMISSWNAVMLAGSRLVYTMARMGMVPPTFKKVHPRYGTPVNALILATGVSIIFGLLGNGALKWFLDITGIAIGTAWAVSVISMIVMRKKYPHLDRPFKTPGGVFTGMVALALVLIVLVSPFIPGTPTSLVWPYEYGVLVFWVVLGVILYHVSKPERERLGEETIARNLLGEYYDSLIKEKAK